MIPMAAEIVSAGADAFGVTPVALRYIGGMDGNVYAYERGGAPYVLKLVPTDAEHVAIIRERQRFAAYLAANGVSVATPVAARGGEMAPVVEYEGAMVVAMSFERAAGEHLGGHRPTRQDAPVRVLGTHHGAYARPGQDVYPTRSGPDRLAGGARHFCRLVPRRCRARLLAGPGPRIGDAAHRRG